MNTEILGDSPALPPSETRPSDGRWLGFADYNAGRQLVKLR